MTETPLSNQTERKVGDTTYRYGQTESGRYVAEKYKNGKLIQASATREPAPLKEAANPSAPVHRNSYSSSTMGPVVVREKGHSHLRSISELLHHGQHKKKCPPCSKYRAKRRIEKRRRALMRSANR